MNRRDTIIIAVLVNAGLLAILFMMAVHPDDEKVNDQFEVSQSPVYSREAEVQQETNIATFMQTTHGDEVDDVLKNFVTPPTQIALGTEINNVQRQERPTQPITPTLLEVSTNGAQYVDITVKRGDSLDKIARANGTTVQTIKTANQLKNERIDIGQVLRIPLVAQAASEASNATNRATPSIARAESTTLAQNEAQYYTIKNGDNPWKIAKQFKVRVDELLQLNGLDEEKARNLKVGDKIRVH